MPASDADDEEWIEKIRERARATGDTGEDVLELLDMIERGLMISSTAFPIWIRSTANMCVRR